MKSRHLFWGMAAFLVLEAFGMAGCEGLRIGPVSKEAFGYYYHPDDGRQVRLVLVRDYIGMEIEGIQRGAEALTEEDEALLEGIVAGEPDLVGIEWGDSVSQGAAPATFYGRPVQGLNDEAVLALIARLNTANGVTSAEPVVIQDFFPDPLWCRYCEGYSTVEPYFTAVFSSGTPETEIDALIAQYSLESDRLDRRGNVVAYRLRTTNETRQSTLEMANLFHENPLTSRAYPEISGGPVTFVN